MTSTRGTLETARRAPGSLESSPAATPTTATEAEADEHSAPARVEAKARRTRQPPVTTEPARSARHPCTPARGGDLCRGVGVLREGAAQLSPRRQITSTPARRAKTSTRQPSTLGLEDELARQHTGTRRSPAPAPASTARYASSPPETAPPRERAWSDRARLTRQVFTPLPRGAQPRIIGAAALCDAAGSAPRPYARLAVAPVLRAVSRAAARHGEAGRGELAWARARESATKGVWSSGRCRKRTGSCQSRQVELSDWQTTARLARYPDASCSAPARDR